GRTACARSTACRRHGLTLCSWQWLSQWLPRRRLSWLRRLIDGRTARATACRRRGPTSHSRQRLPRRELLRRLSFLHRTPSRRPKLIAAGGHLVPNRSGLLRHRRRQRRSKCRLSRDPPCWAGWGGRSLRTLGRRPAGRIGNRGDVRRVVDHDPVVDIRKDHVVRRWGDESRRAAPNRNRYKDRNWQYKDRDGRGRRGQIDELQRRWRQEENRRRRRGRERIDRIVKDENRLIQIDGLFRRWRRHVVFDE